MASIRLRGNKYHVQVRRRGLPSLTKSFLTKRDAESWARQKEVEADKGEVGPERRALKGITLGCLVKRYRQEVVPSKKGAEVERIILNAFLRHPICLKKLSNLTPGDFAAYRDERLGKITAKSVKRQLSPIHNMFEVARDEWGLPLKENPLDKVKLKAVDNRRERRLKEGELERILEAAKNRRNPYIIPIILFALETAMRRGETLALRWEDIDWRRSTATIREAKNGYSRTIPLTSKAMKVLENTIDIQKGMSNGIRSKTSRANSSTFGNSYLPIGKIQEQSEVTSEQLELLQYLPIQSKVANPCQSYTNSPEAPIGATEVVFPVTANAFRLAWQRTIKLTGIQDLHFHDLRHEAISRFFELGLTVPEVASISGHRDARMLLRYAHAQTKIVQEKLSQLG